MSKNKLCCSNIEKNYLIGCRPKGYSKKKYKKGYKKKYKPKKYFNKKGNKDTRKTLWKKRKSYKNKRKTKKCKCYICEEEGHYANECPKKKNRENIGKVKIMETMILEHNLEPLEEEEFSKTASLYELQSETESIIETDIDDD